MAKARERHLGPLVLQCIEARTSEGSIEARFFLSEGDLADAAQVFLPGRELDLSGMVIVDEPPQAPARRLKRR